MFYFVVIFGQRTQVCVFDERETKLNDSHSNFTNKVASRGLCNATNRVISLVSVLLEKIWVSAFMRRGSLTSAVH
jgi:hypothetical protein